jgi:hypothetical protein
MSTGPVEMTPEARAKTIRLLNYLAGKTVVQSAA